MKSGLKEHILMKKLTMICMTLNILLISMTCKCSTKTKKLKQIILGIPMLLEPHEMEMVADDDYLLSLQVQTTRDQDNLSDQNLSPDHEPIVG
jgi:hypothetical protein